MRLRAPAGSAVFLGRLGDVSARGVRFRTEGMTGFGPEDPVRVEIHLDGYGGTSDASRVQLTGRGVVLRAAELARGDQELVVRFDAPLAFLERFPAFRYT